ncbi:hypothetical protein PLESTB_000478000 [Pleodorina starrii]|uniref:Uncharacterized protein n=1 Tax=Pleodorina starrii TaxID=330485 RepID=A0A9W6BFQ4_9CHLO|nr:hypothetical protein PLESTB_000478000 [Pleodorina starrii]
MEERKAQQAAEEATAQLTALLATGSQAKPSDGSQIPSLQLQVAGADSSTVKCQTPHPARSCPTRPAAAERPRTSIKAGGRGGGRAHPHRHGGGPPQLDANQGDGKKAAAERCMCKAIHSGSPRTTCMGCWRRMGTVFRQQYGSGQSCVWMWCLYRRPTIPTSSTNASLRGTYAMQQCCRRTPKVGT